MTIYAGETITISHTATDLDNTTELTESDVDVVEIIIYDVDGEEVISITEMDWNSTEERWEYTWDTSPSAVPIDFGSYRAKVIITGIDGSTNWEYKKIRLARNPVE